LGYYYIDGVIEKEYKNGTTCVNGSSGSINVVGGKLLNTSYINVVKGYEDHGDYNTYFYTERYTSVGGLNISLVI